MEIVNQFQQTSIAESSEEYIIGSIRINPRCFTDAFITDPSGGPDIYIEGTSSRHIALDGDIVRVRINSISSWKLNRNLIAARWDQWVEHLGPIVQSIETETVLRGHDQLEELHQPSRLLDTSSRFRQVDSDSDHTDDIIYDGTGQQRTPRRKRHISVSKGCETKKMEATRLPSNLPSGISKLEIQHVLNLPFGMQCVQKTGRVVEVVKQNHSGIAGGFLKPHSTNQALFSPTDSRIPRMLIDLAECPLDFPTKPDRYKDVLFIARMIHWVGKNKFASGSLVKIVGDCNTIEARIQAILIENRIDDTDFPQDAYDELKYLDCLPKNWFEISSKGRRDLTNECIFTIDPKTARDLDDAVSIKQIAEQIYEVGVHIADVSYFVKEMSAVDYNARLRTTSVYLVERVIPMLPRALSEHMCSLNPGEPKLTFSVIWKMDKYGRIIDEWFGRTVIRSCVKLSYEHAQDIIDRPNDLSWIQEAVNMPKLHAFDWNRISKSVIQLNKIARNMRTKRFNDGALKIENVKIKYELDATTGCPTGFTFENRTESNYLIEEFMLQANMSVAKRIHKHSKELAFLRRHPPSDPAVLKEVKEFCDAKGFPLDITSSGSIQKSLNAITDPTTSKVVSFLLLKAMKNAEYICTGALPSDESMFRHFALSVPFYTHFTSPIRRYADVIVHRQLAIALGYERETNEDVNTLKSMSEECTRRKNSSKLISETSQRLYFNLFVQKAGSCELPACVTRIYDHSFDVILVDYNQSGRVFIDKLKSQIEDFKFESFSGVKRLVINWKAPSKKAQKKIMKRKNKSATEDEDRMTCRHDLGSRKNLTSKSDMRIKEVSSDRQQIVEVFDVLRVIVTVDEKDITKLKIDVKTPF